MEICCNVFTLNKCNCRFMDKNTKSLTIPHVNISGDNFAYTDLEKANALNDYFRSISTIDDTNIRLPAFQKLYHI